jgi:hypothetical protein
VLGYASDLHRSTMTRGKERISIIRPSDTTARLLALAVGLLTALMLITSCASPAYGEPVPVIWDDDGSADGVVALLYLLKHPGYDVKAATVSYGIAHPVLDGLPKNTAVCVKPDPKAIKKRALEVFGAPQSFSDRLEGRLQPAESSEPACRDAPDRERGGTGQAGRP